ncbi:MAG: hypothetical protein ACPG4Q_06230 [Phycisphaeraceae bacterium]
MADTQNQQGNEPKTYFGESNEIDPTPGWIPFFFVIAFVAIFLSAFIIVALFVR